MNVNASAKGSAGASGSAHLKASAPKNEQTNQKKEPASTKDKQSTQSTPPHQRDVFEPSKNQSTRQLSNSSEESRKPEKDKKQESDPLTDAANKILSTAGEVGAALKGGVMGSAGLATELGLTIAKAWNSDRFGSVGTA